MEVALITLALILLALAGTPLFVIITAAALLGFYFSGIEPYVVTIEIYRITDTPLLLALPLFTFAGYLLSESNTSQRLVRLSRSLLGWLPAELVMVTLFACALFTAFTGATGVTIVALGALLYPALKQVGYSDRFSLGLVTTAGSLGLLLPPSLPLILYAIVVQQLNLGEALSITDLFVAGILPTLLMLFMLGIWALWVTRKDVIPLQPFDRKAAWAALRDAKWELPLPVFVLGGIYSGLFAVSEAAAVTALYVLIVELFIYKEIRLQDLSRITQESMTVVGGILLILGVSLAFTNFLIDAEVPVKLFDWTQSHISNKFAFLAVLNIVLLVLGSFLDIFSALVIMVPLLLPVAIGYGISPIHLGIIFLANMQLGYLTPPVGINLFIASYRFNRSIEDIYQATLPMMLVLLVAVLIITYLPLFYY
ncbi:MAG: TRAP transporter large permease subunit [Proteobacteria bacterium]|jgi:tripartite ATP-independent transporter DctM subunit|nr:TRAP transporter large permease subunit [Pseudomonadota bacterium]